MNRVVRSTRVPIAELFVALAMRSPSQCPVAGLSWPFGDHDHVFDPVLIVGKIKAYSVRDLLRAPPLVAAQLAQDIVP